jgi:hypothetical protein
MDVEKFKEKAKLTDRYAKQIAKGADSDGMYCGGDRWRIGEIG